MSYFLDAYNTIMGHEGGYSNDPDDAGGETFKGISRVYNSSWEGWEIIDKLKMTFAFPDNLFDETVEEIRELNKKVKLFYKMKYFDDYLGDEMSIGLATEMFDISVNMGIGRAVKFLQISLNLLNRNEKLYNDMVVDGDYGNTTHRCLQKYLETDTIHLLLKFLNVLQGSHYINYMKKSPIQEKYARGWFNRVEITKK